MRMTEQRRVIARVLSTAKDHPDVEELHRRAAAVDPRISIATVYRTVSCSRQTASWSGTISATDASRYEEAPRRAPRPPDRHQDRQGHRVPQRGDRAPAGADRAAARLRAGRSRLELYGVPLEEKKPRSMSNDRAARAQGALHQDLRLPDERLRLRAHGGRAGGRSAMPRRRRRTTPTWSSSTPAISARRRPRRSIPSSAAPRRSKEARRAEGQGRSIAVAGCVAQAEGAEIAAARAGGGPRRRDRRAITGCRRLIARAGARRARVVETGFPDGGEVRRACPARARAKAVTAFLTVQEGCDKFCTFCVVPYTRGAEFSRPVADDRWPRRGALADRGVREITLLGQNVNAYHGGGPDGRPWPLAG